MHREKAAIQKYFIWGVGPEALSQITRAEYKTEPDKIKIRELNRFFNRTLLTETEHKLQPRRFLLG